MSGLDWAHPEWAGPLLGIWLVAAGAVALAWRRAARARRRLLGANAPARAGVVEDAILLLALLAIGVALAGPQLGHRTLRIPATGVDAVVLLDVSRSMDARDVPPSRLVRARETAREVLGALGPGDRAALAVFAGHGALLTPLTPDKGALAELLDALDSALMSDPGSETARGIEAAFEAFDPASLRPRALLILSDGEHAARTPDDVLRAAARRDVRIVAGAMGSDAGAAVPDRGEPLRDSFGREVVTRRDTAALGRLARATDGAVFASDRWGALDASALAAALRRDARVTPEGVIERRVAVSRSALPAALALGLLLLEAAALRRARRDSPGRGWRRERAAWAPCLLALAASSLPVAAPASAGDPRALEAAIRAQPEDARLLLELGAARAEEGALREAERALLAAVVRARDPELAALAYYDLGVVALQRGDLHAARDAFFDAIALAPGDAWAKFNLEWTLRALSEQSQVARTGAGEGAEEAGAPERSGGATQRESRPAPEAAPAPSEPAGRAGAEGAAGAAPLELDPEQVQRWLEAVQDDPRRALRDAAAGGAEHPRGAGPRW